MVWWGEGVRLERETKVIPKRMIQVLILFPDGNFDPMLPNPMQSTVSRRQSNSHVLFVG